MADLTSIFLFAIAAYMGLISWIGNREVKQNDGFKAETKAKLEEHEKRVQKIEDIQGTKLDIQGAKIDAMSTEFKEFKHDVSSKIDALTAMVHKEKNQEQQMQTVLKLLLERLTKEDLK